MSRIGKMPITVPAGVEVKIDGTTVTVKGPKGELTRTFRPFVTITQEGEEIIVSRIDDSRDAKAQHGLVFCDLLANMRCIVSHFSNQIHTFPKIPIHQLVKIISVH